MNNLSARWCGDVSDLTAGGTVGQEMLHTHIHKETEKFEYFMTSYKPVKGHTSIFFHIVMLMYYYLDPRYIKMFYYPKEK